VRDVYEKTDPLLWLRALDDMPMFMSPHFWLMMRNAMSSTVDGMRWLSDTGYNPPKDIPDYLLGIQNTLPNFERSYPYLVSHIKPILIYLKNHAAFKTVNKNIVIEGLIDLYTRSKKDIHSKYVPIINKRLFVMENTSKGKYTNLAVSDVIDITLLYVKAVNEVNATPNRKSNIMSRTMSRLADVYISYYKNYVASKPGIFRKHIYGARSHFTFRAVITSISGPHVYEEIHVPWAIGVTAFRPHLLNKLVKRGMIYKEASKLLFNSVKTFNPVVNECLKELVAESPYKNGIPVILQRNPSLEKGSAQRVFISYFKEDIYDPTISLSILITTPLNADFDGDEVNCTILGDNLLADEAGTLSTHFNAPGLSGITEISGDLSIPKPCVATLSNYLLEKEDDGRVIDTISKLLKPVEV